MGRAEWPSVLAGGPSTLLGCSVFNGAPPKGMSTSLPMELGNVSLFAKRVFPRLRVALNPMTGCLHGHLETPGAGRRDREGSSSTRVFGGSVALLTLDPGSVATISVREEILVLSHQVCGDLFWQPQETTKEGRPTSGPDQGARGGSQSGAGRRHH